MKNKIFLGVLALGSMVFGIGCGGDACDDAADKFEECGFEVGEGDDDADCSGQAECVAECVNDASCDQITDLSGMNSYTECVAACG